MKYHGSKTLVGEKIAEYIQKNTNYNMLFSPFCGVLGIERHLNFEICFFNDISTDLILFLKELNSNCFTFPTEVTEEKYKELKYSEPSSMRGFVGFFLSFAGKWFGGYAQKYQKGDRVRDFLKEAIDSSKKLQLKGDIIFENKSYDEFTPFGMCIYCDPPYKNTTGYGKFDHTLFWQTMRKWSEHNDVFVSEYDCPFDDFECVFEIQKRVTFGKDKTQMRTEKLFKLKKN
jgi:site-specific DNA-adenine methylase